MFEQELSKMMGETSFGKSQRGSIGFKPEDPFTKFEKSLPLPYKPRAKELWQKLQDEKTKSSFIENKAEQGRSEFVHNITDVRSWYVPISKPFAEAREFLVSGKDITGSELGLSIGQSVSPGGKLYAKQHKNPVVKYGVDIIYAADRGNRVAVEKAIHGATGINPIWSKLSRKEFIALTKVINKYRMKEDLSREKLTSLGMNEKQIKAYEVAKKKTDEIADRIDESRVANGLPIIKREPGYWPSNWGGDFYFEVHKKHSDGRKQLVRIEDRDWSGYSSRYGLKGRGLKGIRERFIAEHPEFEVGEIQKRQIRGYNKDAISLHDQLRDAIDKGSPDREALDRIFEAYNEEIADSTKGFRHHFERNRGVGGYKGNKLERSDWKNAKDFLNSLEGYLRDGNHYIQTKRAAKDINKMLFDEDIQKIHKNALKYVRKYWDKYNGHETLIERAIDSIADQIGLSGNITNAGVRLLRHSMSIFFLALWRPVFILAQRLQSLQFTPPALAKMEVELGTSKYGESVVEAMTKGYFDRSMAFVNPDAMTSLGKEAIKYAKEHHIVDVNWLDDVNHSGGKVWKNTKRTLTGEIALKWVIVPLDLMLIFSLFMY